MKKLVFAMAVVAAGVASAVSFSYQGALKTAEGDPLPANERNKTISFRLYDTPTDTVVLWGRTLAVHLDSNGLFNVELSDTSGSGVTGAKTNDLAWVLSEYPGKGKELYIGLDVLGSSGEIRPRQKLLNVPAAAFAADVATAKRDFTVMGNLVADNVVPKGGIIMWSGRVEDIPEGWALCDGQSHKYKGITTKTPDLRGRFVVGYNPANPAYNNPGKIGGEEFHTLTTNELPAHTHPYTIGTHVVYAYAPSDHNSQNGYIYAETGYEVDRRVKDATLAYENKTTESAHENRPPFYTLCFIMKL